MGFIPYNSGERSEPAALGDCVALWERERGGKHSPPVEHRRKAAGADCSGSVLHSRTPRRNPARVNGPPAGGL